MNLTDHRKFAAFRAVRSALSAAFICGAPLFAQQANSSAASDESEDVVVLNPFVIESDTETGWVATQSLAGSRMNTNLKDIAAPIEVLTKDFMDEFGITSIEEATIYTTNVEGVGDNLETGPGLGFSTGFPPPTRIRGLGNGTLSRDFFSTRMGTDNYNLDRITIASGPNNLLFGTGSPAGVIDVSLKRAMFRDFKKIDTQFDDNGSARFAADINEELIDGKLAFRLSLVHEEKEFDYKPNGYDHDRQYFTAQWRPFSKTQVSVMFENVDIETIRPSLLLPFDNVSPWENASNIDGYVHTANRPLFANPSVDLSQGNLGWNNSAINNTVFNRMNNNPTLITGPNGGGLSGNFYNTNNWVTIKPPKDLPDVNAVNREADGFSFIDDRYFPTDNNVAGFSKRQRDNSKLYNVFINQQVGENLFFEFAAQKEEFDGWNVGMMGYIGAYTVKVDPNMYLPDGSTPNPNVGKYYIEGDPFRTHNLFESEDWRFTGSYELDFEKKEGSWWRNVMGKQRLSGLVSGNTSESRQGEYFERILPQGGLTGYEPQFPGQNFRQPYDVNGAPNNGWADDGTRKYNHRYYLDPANGDYFPRTGADMFAPSVYTDASGQQFTVDMENTGLTDQYGRRLGAGRTSYGKNKLETQQLAYQGFFWDNRLVATLGWRKDTTNSTLPTNQGNRDDQFTGLQPVIEDVAFAPYDPDTEASGTTRTIGFVARPLAGIDLPLGADVSLSYNESDTFQPDASAFDPYGNLYPGASGAGEDKKVTLGLFDGKFALHYTEFENTAGPARAANVPYNRFRFTLSGPLNRIMNLAFGNARTPINEYNNGGGFNGLGNGNPYWVTSFQKATGTEWGLDWNVTDNFTIRFNMNDQEVVESDIGLDWWAWMDENIPLYQALTFPEGGVNNPTDLDGNGQIDTWNWNTAWRSNSNQQTVAEWYENAVINGSNGQKIIQSLDGKANEFVRQSRYNINWVYRFREGKLNGFSIGGAFRHRAAPLLSYGVTGGSLDLAKPLYGAEENLFDLSINYRGKADFWAFNGYRVGLNVRNVFDEDDLYAKLRDVNGQNIRAGRVSQARTFILSLSFDL